MFDRTHGPPAPVVRSVVEVGVGLFLTWRAVVMGQPETGMGEYGWYNVALAQASPLNR